MLPLEELGNATGELHDLDPPGDGAPRIIEGLAVLGRNDAGQLVQVVAQEHLEPEQDPGPGGRSGRRPIGEGGPGRRYGGIDFALRGEGDPRLHRAGGRVEDVAEAVPARACPLAAHEMIDGGGHGPLLKFPSIRKR